MLNININSKLQTLFATGGATGGATVPARLRVARLTTVLFVLITAMFILTGCGLGSLINAARTGNLPCNLNPFQAKCYPEITEELLAGATTVNLTEDEIADLTDKEKADREASIKRRTQQEADRKAALAKYAPQRQALIEPVVAECTVNPRAERCRDAFVWCSDFENTNSPECASALAAESGVFSCLKNPYDEACDQQAALQEEISGQVVVRDEETGDVMLDDNGEEVTIEKKVTLVENTRQARINYCRDTNDQGEANIDANPVLCESTVTNVCEDPENPSGVFDVFCKDDPEADETPYADERERIVNGCNDGSLSGVEQGCTSVVEFCNKTPFGNSNCDIPAFNDAREVRVDLCINARTTAETNECGVELANNPCFGDPFVDGTVIDGETVNCASEYNMGNTENVKTAQQSRATLCVNAFIAETYTDVCGGASATACVTDPFGGSCAEDLGAGHIIAKQTRARYCIVGDRTDNRLCLGATREPCMQNPYHTDCGAFFGTADQDKNAQQFRTNHCETQITAGTVTTDDLCDSYLDDGIACKSNPFRKTPVLECAGNSKYDANRKTIVDACRADSTIAGCTSNFINSCINNPFARFAVSATDKSLIPDEEACGADHFDSANVRLKLVNDCRAGTRTEGCDGDSSIALCNGDPFADYATQAGTSLPNFCAGAHFDGARIAACTDATAAGTADCTDDILTRPNTATWAKKFRDDSETLVALNTTTPKNQFLVGTANGIDTTGTTATATLLTIGDDFPNGVGFFSANSKFYAGLFDGANLGEPLSDTTKNGEWTGSLQAVVGSASTDTTVLPMTLTVTYGGTNTIEAFVPSGSNYFLLEGEFTAEGVISGDVNYGPFTVTGGVGTTTRAINGTLTGLIGQDGALGAFHSLEAETSGYAGGFVATKPTE